MVHVPFCAQGGQLGSCKLLQTESQEMCVTHANLICIVGVHCHTHKRSSLQGRTASRQRVVSHRWVRAAPLRRPRSGPAAKATGQRAVDWPAVPHACTWSCVQAERRRVGQTHREHGAHKVARLAGIRCSQGRCAPAFSLRIAIDLGPVAALRLRRFEVRSAWHGL